MPAAPAGNKPAPITVNLALQGGGSHGAFTWGVLDRLLEEDEIGYDTVCGVSAGSVNGAALTAGLATGGRAAARETLDRLWRRTAEDGRFGPFQPGPLDRLMGNRDLTLSPGYQVFDLMMRMVSPYQMNPLDYNPLRQLLGEAIDLDAVARSTAPRLLVGATNVLDGRLHLFEGEAITADALVASACLPFLWQAVEVDGRRYWDGGNSGNPPLIAIGERATARDTVIVQVTPVSRKTVPMDQTAIIDRMSEIASATLFQQEAERVATADRLIAAGVDPSLVGAPAMRLHRIEADWRMADFGASSKLNTDWSFLTELFELGRTTADVWLAENGKHLGERATWSPVAEWGEPLSRAAQ